jgi:hypothetical protein
MKRKLNLAGRLFSTFRLTLPNSIKDEFEGFHNLHLSNRKLPDYPSEEVSQRIAKNLAENLKKDESKEAQEIIYSVVKARKGKARTILLENIPTVGKSAEYFVDAFSRLIGLKPFTKDRKKHEVDPVFDQSREILPHTDGIFANNEFLQGKPPEVITLYATNGASKANYNTCTLKLEDVLERLSSEEKLMLEESVFIRAFKRKDLAGPILFKDENGSYLASFMTGAPYHIMPSEKYSPEVLRGAVNKMESAILSVYEEEKIETFRLKNGSLLIIDNAKLFHYRDQKNIPKEDLDFPRKVFGLDYTSIESESDIFGIDDLDPSPSLSAKAEETRLALSSSNSVKGNSLS